MPCKADYAVVCFMLYRSLSFWLVEMIQTVLVLFAVNVTVLLKILRVEFV